MNFSGITKITKTVGGVVSKNSPTILTGMSVAGLVATAAMGIKATPKALQIIEDETYKKEEELTKKEIIKLTWKCYVPTFVLGAATVGCIIGANSINLRRNAALASAYTLAESAMKEYQSKVVERIGSVGDREIRDEIARDRVARNPVVESEIVLTGNGDDLCYEALSGRYFKSSRVQIETALNNIDRKLRNENYISLNEVYYELDLEGIGLGDVMGFYVGDGGINPDFTSMISESGKPCLVLDFKVQPRYYKRDY